MSKCATAGRCNAGPVSNRARQQKVPLEAIEDERSHAPIVWPRHLDEDSGRVNPDWEAEMMRARIAFWQPLGARLLWRSTTYSIN